MSDSSLAVGEKVAAGRSRLFRKGLAANGLFLAIAIAYVLALQVVMMLVPGMARDSGPELILGMVTFSIPVALLCLALYIFAVMAATDRPDSPLKHIYWRMKALLSDPRRMAGSLPLFAALLLFMYAFTSFKGNITAIVPFSWDTAFDQLDVALHFGARPYEWLQPVLGYAPITFLLNVNYNAWFFVMNLFWVHYIFMVAPGFSRSRFFLAFMLVVIVEGSLLAIVFSSAGPCYQTLIGLSPDPYQPLMTYLKGVHESLPIWALDTQDMLWRYRSEGSVFGGISAMPSVHNGTALLFVLATWRGPRWLRNVMIAHAALIFIGSVHLGWHYAVDGYLAWIVTLACWALATPLARWWESTRAARDFRAVTGAAA